VRVFVRLMGPYKRAADGVDEVALDVATPDLGGVLAAIRARFPEAGRKLEPSPGKIEPAVRIVLNDVVLQDATTFHAVRDGDRVAFVPIVGGG
jgi:molybdopterin converting factor small subunit